jgi:hypothetical protein
MRRIYESGAVDRDEEDPFRPGDRESPRAMRSVSGGSLSRWLVPYWLRFRALRLEVATPRSEYAAGERIPFAVTVENTYPIPITVPTLSPLLWRWEVDGAEEGSRLPRELPDRQGGFEFGRSETKRFTREWPQLFKVSETEWEEAGPGEYTIGAWLNVDDAEQRGLADAVTVRVTP